MSVEKSSINGLQLIHRSMLFGLIIFAALAFFLNYSNRFEAFAAEYDHMLQVIVILVAAAGFFIGNNYFKNKVLRLAQEVRSPQEKIAIYRHTSIIQWALLEGPAILAIICFLLTGNFAFLALAATIILLFAMAAPSKQKVALLLSLSEQDMENL